MKPNPILSVGVTGHRVVDPALRGSIEERLASCLRHLQDGLAEHSARESALYADAPPRLRVVSMFAEGTDLIAMTQARAAGADLVAVFPSTPDAFRDTYSDESQLATYDGLVRHATAIVQLHASKDRTRFYERANDVILARSDVLVTVWDGLAARGRGGTADVVQRAVELGLPVIVIEPSAGTRIDLVADGDRLLIRPNVLDLSRVPVEAGHWIDLVARAIGVGPRGRARQQVIDFYSLQPRVWGRPGHQLLLALAGSGHLSARRSRGRSWNRPEPAASALADRLPDPRSLREPQVRASRLARRFGEQARSAALLRSFVAALVALASGIVAIAFPHLEAIALAIQAAANIALLVDHVRARKGLWNERWVAQRAIAERLRCLRFLVPLGLTATMVRRRSRSSAAGDWLSVRLAREREGSADFTPEVVFESQRLLADVEMPEQMDYHRMSRRQLLRLERRLTLLAALATLLLIVAAVWHLTAPGLGSGQRALVSLILAVAPAFVAAFNGLKAESDLLRLVDRSGRTLARLRSLSIALRSASPSVDVLFAGALLAADAMIDDSDNWAATSDRKLDAGPWARR